MMEYLKKVYEEPINLQARTLVSVGVPYKPGQKLPTGSVILSEKRLRLWDHRLDTLILAMNEIGVYPFVTWVRTITTDSPVATGGYQIVDTCSWGHYFKTVEEALDNFNLRYKEKTEMFDETGALVLPS